MTVHLGAPQIVWLCIALFSLVQSTINHGKPRDPENARATLLGSVLAFALLYWGGFFR